ncbi:hypothetical protein N7492_010650 [Penicillium capsulatum]|uniref:Uncharacterized protein n=1 Tax=Penicillium capsulatum TaxID=69766 RepID=A0A9W9HP77_9EURO|nr:hypothetical protein N7492_010650 [Penicillium capsulatum]KAJ6113149.1 hypothetical protein N7512_008473 [Penicillium capsulatum]
MVEPKPLKRWARKLCPVPSVLRKKPSSTCPTDEEIVVPQAAPAIREQHARFGRLKLRQSTIFDKVGQWWKAAYPSSSVAQSEGESSDLEVLQTGQWWKAAYPSSPPRPSSRSPVPAEVPSSQSEFLRTGQWWAAAYAPSSPSNRPSSPSVPAEIASSSVIKAEPGTSEQQLGRVPEYQDSQAPPVALGSSDRNPVQQASPAIKVEPEVTPMPPFTSSSGRPPSMAATPERAGKFTGLHEEKRASKRMRDEGTDDSVAGTPMKRPKVERSPSPLNFGSSLGGTSSVAAAFNSSGSGTGFVAEDRLAIKRERNKDETDVHEEPAKRTKLEERPDSPAYSPSASSDEEEVVVPEKERDDLLNVLTREKALRLTKAFKVPAMFDMGTEEKNLYLNLALRGCKPVMAEHWRKDFTTLPESLFALEENQSPEEAKDPLLKALGQFDFSAIRAFKDLLDVGIHARDCQSLNVEPEMRTKRAIQRYLRWAVSDQGPQNSAKTIPVHAIQVRKPGQDTIQCMEKLKAKLQSMTARFHEALAMSSDRWYPVLIGFMLCGPVTTLVSLDTNPASPAWHECDSVPMKVIGSFDLSERDEDVWNALAIAIATIHTRDTMARLAKSNTGPEFPRFRSSHEQDDGDDA